MKMMRVFETTSMSEEIWEAVKATDSWIPDGYSPYDIGYYEREYNAYPPDHSKDDLLNHQLIGKWMMDQGATPREIVLIQH